MTRVLITGAAGFVGRHLLAALGGSRITARALVRDPDRARTALGALAAGAELVRGDVTDPASVEAACGGCDAVVHLVAVEFERDGMTFERVHVEGTAHTLRAAERAGARRFVYLGQISPGDDPSFRFTYTKWLGEERVRASGLAWTVLRAGLILGPGDHFVREMARLARFPVVPLAGDGGTRLQPVAVWDVARALVNTLGRADTAGQTLDLAGPEQLTYRDLARRTLVALGRPRPLLAIPSPVLYLPAVVARATLAQPPLTPELLRLLQRPNVSDRNATPDLLGGDPMSVDATLERTARVMQG